MWSLWCSPFGSTDLAQFLPLAATAVLRVSALPYRSHPYGRFIPLLSLTSTLSLARSIHLHTELLPHPALSHFLCGGSTEWTQCSECEDG